MQCLSRLPRVIYRVVDSMIVPCPGLVTCEAYEVVAFSPLVNMSVMTSDMPPMVSCHSVTSVLFDSFLLLRFYQMIPIITHLMSTLLATARFNLTAVWLNDQMMTVLLLVCKKTHD